MSTLSLAAQVEIPFSRVFGRQRGRRFDALAQAFAETASIFLRRYIVPAATRAGADLLEFALPEIADGVSGTKNFKAASENKEKL